MPKSILIEFHNWQGLKRITKCEKYSAYVVGFATILFSSNSLISQIIRLVGRDFPAMNDEENQRLLKEARGLFEVILPSNQFTSRPDWITAVANKTGLKESRVKSIFYNPAIRIHAQEMDLIRATAFKKAEAA